SARSADDGLKDETPRAGLSSREPPTATIRGADPRTRRRPVPLRVLAVRAGRAGPRPGAGNPAARMEEPRRAARGRVRQTLAAHHPAPRTCAPARAQAAGYR